MKNNRRDFLKVTGLASLGLASSSLLKGLAIDPKELSVLDSLVLAAGDQAMCVT